MQVFKKEKGDLVPLFLFFFKFTIQKPDSLTSVELKINIYGKDLGSYWNLYRYYFIVYRNGLFVSEKSWNVA